MTDSAPAFAAVKSANRSWPHARFAGPLRGAGPVEPAPEPIAATTPDFYTYALGWVIRDYRGHRIVMHEGVLEGALSETILIPERHVAFIVMLNLSSPPRPLPAAADE